MRFGRAGAPGRRWLFGGLRRRPKNGTYRTEEASIAAERPANDSRAACIGKPVNAVAVYYKPKDEFAGDDEMVIDVDFKNGRVRRYVYAITVR